MAITHTVKDGLDLFDALDDSDSLFPLHAPLWRSPPQHTSRDQAPPRHLCSMPVGFYPGGRGRRRH
jgi:hypothetical protein